MRPFQSVLRSSQHCAVTDHEGVAVGFLLTVSQHEFIGDSSAFHGGVHKRHQSQSGRHDVREVRLKMPPLIRLDADFDAVIVVGGSFEPASAVADDVADIGDGKLAIAADTAALPVRCTHGNLLQCAFFLVRIITHFFDKSIS